MRRRPLDAFERKDQTSPGCQVREDADTSQGQENDHDEGTAASPEHTLKRVFGSLKE